MSVQDRNIHRDAQALRKVVTIPLIVPSAGVDQDEPIYASIPRYNWRLSELSAYANALATATMIVKAQAVPHGSAVGAPQLSQAAAVTFGIEEFWKHNADSEGLGNVAATAAQPFTGSGGIGIATVLDGFWGVWLIQVNQSADKQAIAQAPIMAFATEEIALANCPKVRAIGGVNDVDGRLAILTVNAVGGDFIAGTTNTDAWLVAAFNTAPQDGHTLTMPISTTPNRVNSTLGQQLKDASGTDILQGRGEGVLTPGVGGGGMIVLSVRSAGAPVVVGGVAELEYRPWPAGGEGLGDTSVSQTRPTFTP